eukprot:663596-Pyramimonas_sp.AAC.1
MPTRPLRFVARAENVEPDDARRPPSPLVADGRSGHQVQQLRDGQGGELGPPAGRRGVGAKVVDGALVH